MYYDIIRISIRKNALPSSQPIFSQKRLIYVAGDYADKAVNNIGSTISPGRYRETDIIAQPNLVVTNAQGWVFTSELSLEGHGLDR